MAKKSKIEWTDETWNPVTGCTKVSQGCKHCYAEREWKRLSANPKTVYFGREFTDVRCHPERLDQPLRWIKPRRIFVNSMSDLFHEDVPDDFIDQVFGVMAGVQQHTFQVLTKRPERMRDYLKRWSTEIGVRDFVKYWPEAETMRWPLPNVWIGVSIEDQATADERIPLLLQTPASVLWISAEPLLGPVNLRSIYLPDGGGVDALRGIDTAHQCHYAGKIDWIVVGGESGPKARPMHPDWVHSLRNQCEAAGVPFLFKQWGEWIGGKFDAAKRKMVCQAASSDDSVGEIFWLNPGHPPVHFWDMSDHYWRNASARVGKKASGRLLDGVLHDGYPA